MTVYRERPPAAQELSRALCVAAHSRYLSCPCYDALFEANSGIDLVVLDLAMPVMDGEQAYRRIKAIRPETPILISSGYSELMASSRFGPGGMEGFIQKPYTASQFTERVRKMLQHVRK